MDQTTHLQQGGEDEMPLSLYTSVSRFSWFATLHPLRYMSLDFLKSAIFLKKYWIFGRGVPERLGIPCSAGNEIKTSSEHRDAPPIAVLRFPSPLIFATRWSDSVLCP